MLKNLFRSTLLLGVLAGIAGVGAYGAISYLITREDPVIVPDLTGEDIVPVLQTLAGLGLYPKIEALAYSAALEKNRVLRQEPAPGSSIKKGREVRLTLSKGPLTVVLPDLIGLPLKEARGILIAQGLCEGRTSRTRNAQRSFDEVLAQTPGPGMVISRETCVDLLINLEEESEAYLMPDLTGKNLTDGLAYIAALGLKPGEIRQRPHPAQRPDTITAQTPAGGTPVHADQRVDLVGNAGRHSGPPAARPASRLLRHRLAPGFLKQRVRIQWRTDSLTEDLFDQFVPPGEEVWVLIPGYQNAAVDIFESETRVKTGTFELQGTP